MNDPCYKCEERTVICHSVCDKYKKFRAKKDAENEKLKKFRELECAIYETKISGIARNRKTRIRRKVNDR